MIRAPVMPNGCPTAMAPPWTFRRSGSTPSCRAEGSTCAAKASLTSTRSMSSMPSPARARACRLASTGPRPITSGESPLTPVDTIRASGARPSSSASVSLMTTRAAAPSLRAQQFPAVTVPSGRNTGSRPASESTVTPARGPSSRATTVPSGRSTGVISRSQNPLASASWARCWLRAANSSCSSRVIPHSSATFSAVWPIATYTSGRPPTARGSAQRSPPAASVSLRAIASASRGLRRSSPGMWSLVPRVERLTASTPAETNTSPSPALIAWKAIRVDWRLDAQ